MTDIYRKINMIAVIAGGVECNLSREQAEADLRYICAAVASDDRARLEAEVKRLREALNDRIQCHDAGCVEKRNSGRCVARDVLMRCCADRDARMAMGDSTQPFAP